MRRKLVLMGLATSLLVIGLTACGGGGGGGSASSGTSTGASDNSQSPWTMSLFAGNVGGAGQNDGVGSLARFSAPAGIAIDSAGNVYVADILSGAIRKITPAGVVTTFAGSTVAVGSTDGIGSAARFELARGVATDGAGNVYVADSGNSTIRKITSAGVVTTLAGTAKAEGSADGTGPAALFKSPYGIATDSAGNVYVADTLNHTIRKVTPAGAVSTLAGTAGTAGSSEGTGSAARFDRPMGVATDSAGNLYVADTFNHVIRKVTPSGVVTTLAGVGGATGAVDGTGSGARFTLPMGIVVDGAGNVYVADSGNSLIRKVSPAGAVTTLAGKSGYVGSTDGSGVAALFFSPNGIAQDGAGNLYVADTGNDTVRKVSSAGVVTTLAGTATVRGSTDGLGAAATFNAPDGIAADGLGNLYVADADNNTIRKINPVGVVTTLAGAAGMAGSEGGIGPAARFDRPLSVATDGAGNVYVADANNNTIRKITPDGVVTTLAGAAGAFGSSDGTGSAARFNFPRGVATDSAGNVYVADANNHTVRKITSSGVVSTLAGAAGVQGSTDGAGAAARFNEPYGIAIDGTGNVFVADAGNRTIRRITPAGVVTTLAGTAGMSGSSDGAPGTSAFFSYPQGLATDIAGNVYVADAYNRTIRKITPAGVVSTLAGTANKFGFDIVYPGVLGSTRGVALSGNKLYFSMLNGVVQIENFNSIQK